MTLHENALTYLLRFLTGLDDETVLRTFRIGYTDDEEKFAHYDLVFIPSGFFESEHYGQAASIPQTTQEINGIPFLYGNPTVEKRGQTILVHADLPASAFFFLSRYEEICRRDLRDLHGRFPGKESFAYRNNLLCRPLVDEYGVLVRQWLRNTGKDIPEPEPKVAKLWVTHDVDAPFFCQSLRAVARETWRGKGLLYALKVFFGPLSCVTAAGNTPTMSVSANRCESFLRSRPNAISNMSPLLMSVPQLSNLSISYRAACGAEVQASTARTAILTPISLSIICRKAPIR